MVIDAMGPEMYNNYTNPDVCGHEEQAPNQKTETFFRLLEEADKHVWPGCRKQTNVSTMAQILNLKSESNMHASCYDQFDQPNLVRADAGAEEVDGAECRMSNIDSEMLDVEENAQQDYMDSSDGFTTSAKHWNEIIEKQWNNERWKTKSKSGRDNRLTLKSGTITKHTAGSITIAAHKLKLHEKLGKVTYCFTVVRTCTPAGRREKATL
ncbi:Transposase associated domain-containing protein [Forsythia ovata]|uniref:Transposase associated domain-containing protein n=1 Tax=Forsythia ovata TaxID=205694 RepID=A0ABD1SIY5_9LAMI